MAERRVVVVGGGVIGVCCAYFLAKEGAGVILVERDEIGGGASFGNAGTIAGTMDPGTGHHHLVVDGILPVGGVPMPSIAGHSRPYGSGTDGVRTHRPRGWRAHGDRRGGRRLARPTGSLGCRHSTLRRLRRYSSRWPRWSRRRRWWRLDLNQKRRGATPPSAIIVVGVSLKLKCGETSSASE